MTFLNTVTKFTLSAVLIAAFSAPAFAVDPANHNTTRSNKTKPIAAPTGDAVDGSAKMIGDGHVTVLKAVGSDGSSEAMGANGADVLTGCVTVTGAVDDNCDGVADALPATDYNSSRSNKADTISSPNPDDHGGGGGDDDGDDTKATDYNSSRSNKNSNH